MIGIDHSAEGLNKPFVATSLGTGVPRVCFARRRLGILGVRFARSGLDWIVDDKRPAVVVILCATLLLITPVARSQLQLKPPTATPHIKEIRRVLVFNDLGSISSPGFAAIDHAILTGLEKSPYQIEFYSENLETTLFPDEAFQRWFRQWYIRKYHDRKPDVIIAVGQASLKFMIESHETSFPNTPIIFCGSTEEVLGKAGLDSHFTGVWEVPKPEETLKVALHLRPDTRHVVVVGGVGTFDRDIEATVKERLHSYESTLDFTYLTDLDMPTLLERLGNLPSKTVVFHTSIMLDAAGTGFIDASQSAPMVANAANAPVFVIDDVDIGGGTVGGDVLSWSASGEVAARMAVRVLTGEKPQNIPIVRNTSSYVFDWRALKRWDVSESKLPAGSIILFRRPTLWERFRWILVSSVLVSSGMVACTIYLLYSRRQMKLARNEQIRLSGKLINAQEDERKLLASELHDDFSQRLALLSLRLETASEMIPESPQEANRQLQELVNSASEIGADLHALSHHLHSSTLERLGLVSGVEAFCKEFSTQQGIQVAFLHDNIPYSIDPDMALCLFRIVQEGLHNVKKHSRATKANVTLKMVDRSLHLSITDDGEGFNVGNPTLSQGLGIRSMEERARLIGARFEIRSKPQEGTHIEVWKRLQQKSGDTAEQAAARSAFAIT